MVVVVLVVKIMGSVCGCGVGRDDCSVGGSDGNVCSGSGGGVGIGSNVGDDRDRDDGSGSAGGVGSSGVGEVDDNVGGGSLMVAVWRKF